MSDVFQPDGRRSADASAWNRVVAACRRIPPLWDLPNFVAVNPFLGFTSGPIELAARALGETLGARVLPPVSYYRERLHGPGDLAAAANRSGVAPGRALDVLDGRRATPKHPAGGVLTFAERHDRRHGTDLEGTARRQIARWCAVYASGAGASWGLPDGDLGLYAPWRESAAVDRTFEILGVTGWRARVRELPATAEEAIAHGLRALGVDESRQEGYFGRLLGGLHGWASFFRRDGWSRGDTHPGTVAELLAVRLVVDAILADLSGTEAEATPAGVSSTDGEPVEDEAIRVVFQDALEDVYAKRLVRRFNPPDRDETAPRPAVQAVFCIDVRSEPLRRHLEAQADEIETRGFAGFFGVALDWRPDGETPSARCPVLLRPAVTVACPAEAPRAPSTGIAKQLLGAPASAFSLVEVLGLGYGLALAADSLAVRDATRSDDGSAPFALAPDGRGAGIAPSARATLAAGILKNMGFGARFARLVLLCGHEGHSANNPHAAGLDCGACGGHSGAVNARVAAALLNDPDVRDALPALGWALPADTRFVAGVHDTTTDDVRLLDVADVPASHRPDLDRLRAHLARAGDATRAERAPALGLAERRPGLLGRLLGRRSRDWSEVRPEWGLARNAAFVAARRDRTRGVDLQGRAFLHEYDAALDPDGSVLTLILSAPMVVASWINLQYFASTVDNGAFGSGSKVLHQRIGSLGVVLGNGGDLRPGLPIQSVHAPDGTWYHEPLRLQVVVEAPRDRIDSILAAQPSVRDLVENGWVRLIALDPESPDSWLRLRDGGWEPFTEPNVAGSTTSRVALPLGV